MFSVGPLPAGSGLDITGGAVDQLNIPVLSDGSTLEDPHEVTDAMLKRRRDPGAAPSPEELTVVEISVTHS